MPGFIKLSFNLTNKRKIFNDPVYGFITIPTDLIFQLIEHPYFQRLRRIKQLGLAELVYPGAVHSRFQHALGAMHLMNEALKTLGSKGVDISDEEKEAALIAILLHDIGHGPFSHVLEHTFLSDISHETVSKIIIEKLNLEFEGRLSLAIDIFKNDYHRAFLHQLVSGQLDVDRLDYLNRDSFFTAVAEGKIGAERIIKMLNVKDDQLVVDEKGLMSVENFLVARQHMYWQVYYHKTALCAETILLKTFERVRDLIREGKQVEMAPDLYLFLSEDVNKWVFEREEHFLEAFVNLDDSDIWSAIKAWALNSDPILSVLSRSLLDRKLYKITFGDSVYLDELRNQVIKKLKKIGIDRSKFKYFLRIGEVSTHGYDPGNSGIKILWKTGKCEDITEASILPTIPAIAGKVSKTFLSYPNDVYLQYFTQLEN